MDQSIEYGGTVNFPNPPKATMLYFNSYEIIVTGGNAAKREGLLFFPYLMKRIPVEWENITIRKGEDPEDPLDKDFGCIVGKDDKIQVQGSDASVLSDDLNKQFTALAAWLNDPGSFTGTFGEALDSLRKSAIGEDVSVNRVPIYAKTVTQDFEKWASDLNTTANQTGMDESTKDTLTKVLQELNNTLALLRSVKTLSSPVNLTASVKNDLIILPSIVKGIIERMEAFVKDPSILVKKFFSSSQESQAYKYLWDLQKDGKEAFGWIAEEGIFVMKRPNEVISSYFKSRRISDYTSSESWEEYFITNYTKIVFKGKIYNVLSSIHTHPIDIGESNNVRFNPDVHLFKYGGSYVTLHPTILSLWNIITTESGTKEVIMQRIKTNSSDILEGKISLINTIKSIPYSTRKTYMDYAIKTF